MHIFRVTKEIDVNSKEGKAELKKLQEKDEQPSTEAADGPAKTASLLVLILDIHMYLLIYCFLMLVFNNTTFI